MKRKMQRSGMGKGRGAPATWRTNSQFGIPVTVTAGSPVTDVIVGVIPQSPVAAGNPEPTTAFDVLQIQGGFDLGTINTSSLSPQAFRLGFGIYKAAWDPLIGNWIAQDPLAGVDVCEDNWLHLEWRNLLYGPAQGTASGYVFGSGNEVHQKGMMRFNSGRHRLREGQALIGVVSVDSTANLTIVPSFRYLIRMAA